MPDLFGAQSPVGAHGPSWFSSGTATQRAFVLRGLHPLGLPLNDDARTTCGGCAHLFKKSRGGSWLKCALRCSGGPATDVRIKWRGCAAWKPRGGGPTPEYHAAD